MFSNVLKLMEQVVLYCYDQLHQFGNVRMLINWEVVTGRELVLVMVSREWLNTSKTQRNVFKCSEIDGAGSSILLRSAPSVWECADVD